MKVIVCFLLLLSLASRSGAVDLIDSSSSINDILELTEDHLETKENVNLEDYELLSIYYGYNFSEYSSVDKPSWTISYRRKNSEEFRNKKGSGYLIFVNNDLEITITKNDGF